MTNDKDVEISKGIFFGVVGFLALTTLYGFISGIWNLVNRSDEKTHYEFQNAIIKADDVDGSAPTTILTGVRENFHVQGELHGDKGGDHHVAAALGHVIIAGLSLVLLVFAIYSYRKENKAMDKA
ncbi:MAG: hypothetical protein H6850_02120 [Alphaproteobacteria bacterium]|nr:MAG: hypothetical protein H6850_02120 [Alphaproteobacteria bacterium]